MSPVVSNAATVVPVLATSLLPQDTIIATLTSRDGSGKLIRVSHTWNGDGVEVDGNGAPLYGGIQLSAIAPTVEGIAAPPVFDAEGYRKALNNNDKKGADAISQQYMTQVQEYRGQANAQRPLADRIRAAVYATVCSTHDIAEEDRPSGMVLREDQVQVRVPLRYGDTPAVFTVSMAPVWG